MTPQDHQQSHLPPMPPPDIAHGSYCDPDAPTRYLHTLNRDKRLLPQPSYRRTADYLRAGLVTTGLVWLLLTIGAAGMQAQSQVAPQVNTNTASIAELKADQKALSIDTAALKLDVAVMRTQLNLLLQIGWGVSGAIGVLLLERVFDYLRGAQQRGNK